MNSLLLLYAPPDAHGRKNRAPASAGIVGADVFRTDVVRALVTHGSYDRYCFLRGASQPDRGDTGRIQWLDSHNIGDIARLGRPVLAGDGPDFQDHSLVRRIFSPARDWPITSVIHAVPSKSPPAWILPFVLGDVQPWDAVICSSRAQRAVVEHHLDALPEAYPHLGSLDGRPRPRLPIIPLGTELISPKADRRAAMRATLGLAADDLLVLYVGRFSPTTKCDLLPLVAAMSRVAVPAGVRATLLLAGDDTRHGIAPALEALAGALDCGARVKIQPNPTHEEKQDLYRAADLFVSPSDNVQESFGLTVIEAMGAGLPVIASDWNGYRDLVVDGDNGYLVPTYWTSLGPQFDALQACGTPAGDGLLAGATIVDVDRLTDAIERLVRDRTRRRAMAARAQEKFLTEFHWPAIIRRYEALWAELKAHAASASAPAGALVTVSANGAEAASSPASSSSSFPSSAPTAVVAVPVAEASGEPAVINGPRRTFRHYPSLHLCDTCRVAIGTHAVQADSLIDAARSMPGKDIPSYAGAARAVLHELRSTPLAIGDLAARVCTDGAITDLTARLAIARLLKHGLLRLA